MAPNCPPWKCSWLLIVRYLEYYQFVLALSVLGGLGSSLLVTPAMGSVSHWFYERRGLAGGVAFVGGGFGGVLFPLMMQSLLPQIGWGWSIRALGLILLLLCGTSVAFCRTRVPPRHGAHTTWRDTLPDPRIFLDGTGAMSVTTAAIVLTDLAYLLPVTYLPSYYMERQNINRDETLTGKAAFAYQLLAIFNAASCVGRCVVGDLGDRFGRYNSMIVSMFLSLLSLLCFFLVDVLVAGLRNVAFLVVFVVLFGFVSGTSISLTPICLGQLCETRDFGRYYASCYTVVAFGCLTSVPIAGRLLDAIEVDGKERYRGVVTFTASSYLLALLCFIWVRVRIQGWDWRTKWWELSPVEENPRYRPWQPEIRLRSWFEDDRQETLNQGLWKSRSTRIHGPGTLIKQVSRLLAEDLWRQCD